MLNALDDANYESLHIQLLLCFQDEIYTSTQKSVYNVIAFLGYQHKQKSMEQATKTQKDMTLCNFTSLFMSHQL